MSPIKDLDHLCVLVGARLITNIFLGLKRVCSSDAQMEASSGFMENPCFAILPGRWRLTNTEERKGTAEVVEACTQSLITDWSELVMYSFT